MLTSKSMKRLFLLSVAIAGLAGLSIVGGCMSHAPSAGSGSGDEQLASSNEPAEPKAGAQLWSESCSRCHNIRPPQYYSDAQWDLIVHHMRMRANLTGEEARAITKFLQASN